MKTEKMQNEHWHKPQKDWNNVWTDRISLILKNVKNVQSPSNKFRWPFLSNQQSKPQNSLFTAITDREKAANRHI